MNALELYITENKLDECDVMNLLQDQAIISASCASAKEVADDENAVAWLRHYQVA